VIDCFECLRLVASLLMDGLIVCITTCCEGGKRMAYWQVTVSRYSGFGMVSTNERARWKGC
jgi:hypothetical protein